ncbi:alpha/beta fold hydrolase [Nonomuraea sp. NPDC049607]|uniref:thioesterase II family protein n=1 Tax=unclassified Nonomuraea TaxID=2593643 RepID=UPI0034454D67
MTRANPWLHRFHPSPEGDLQVVCFPHAGGSSSFYHALSAVLSPSAEVLAVQYPGRQERRHEALVKDLRTLAGQVADALDAESDDRPRLFFGHSMGALVAFQTAVALGGRGPVALFASGQRAPSRARFEMTHLLDDQALVEHVKMLDGSAAAVLDDMELRPLVLPVIRSDYRAIETYRFGGEAPLSCPVVAFSADDDPLTSLAEVQAWSLHTSAGFELRAFSGGHFFIRDHYADVAEAIGEFRKRSAYRE